MPKFYIFLVIILMTFLQATQTFLTEQLTYERVMTAQKEKNSVIQQNLKKHKLGQNNLRILILAFKKEAKLEIYASNSMIDFQLIASYDICASSGKLGPKRRAGDAQVPEGLYHIDRFNPASNYYLSLGINYPNASDKIRSKAEDLGGDIFIHGHCVTIGCLPMTDDKIKEIFLYAIYAKNAGQNKIPVYIFPYRMNSENHTKFLEKYSDNKGLIEFWKELKTAYDSFITNKKSIDFEINKTGKYTIKN